MQLTLIESHQRNLASGKNAEEKGCVIDVDVGSSNISLVTFRMNNILPYLYS